MCLFIPALLVNLVKLWRIWSIDSLMCNHQMHEIYRNPTISVDSLWRYYAES